VITINSDKLKAINNERAQRDRASAFAIELDNLQRKFIRGEDGITLKQLQDKAAEIRARFPYEA
jgi:hypothetical protein